MNLIRSAMKQNPKKFYLSTAALVLGIVGFLLYLSTGIIRGYTDSYSTPLIVFAAAAILCNAGFTVKRLSTLEAIPFVAYVISVFLFVAANANYIIAVVRAIDLGAFSGSFIGTIVLFLAAALLYALSFTGGDGERE